MQTTLSGQIYSKKQNPAKAIHYFSNTIKIDPNHKEAYYYRGLTYLELGKTSLACSDFKKAQTLKHPLAKNQLDNNCN